MKKFLLNGTWHMEGGGFSCCGTVPGSVYSFLLDAKLMEDPFYRTNEITATKLMENDYTFSRSFTFKKPKAGVRVLLRCEGLDTLATICLNGETVGSTKNMHRTYEFDVASVLKDGENEISITFASANKYIKKKFAEDPVRGNGDSLVGHAHIRKAGYMMGWDWGPKLPDAGIWRDISLITLDTDRITEVEILQRHEGARCFVTPRVKTETGKSAVTVTVTSPSGEVFTLAPGVESEIKNPMLWWPHGFGEPNLYTFEVVITENGVAVDSDKRRIGLRDLKLSRVDDEYGQSFCHEVNGVKIFAMGADYIPEDNLLVRITEERTRALLESCIECNFNTIRVWGGGFYPHDFFFELCDELGLLIFFDLMFACMIIPSGQEMEDEIREEVYGNLRRIRHHASIAVISGNNEIEQGMASWFQGVGKETYLRIFEDVIPKVVAEVCPYLPYVPSSPSSYGSLKDPTNEDVGDSHYWMVWHGNLPFSDYRNHYFRYLSEFGFESFPCEKTINAVTLPEERNIFSRTMEMHQRCRGANGKILTYLSSTFLYPTEFGTLLYASQLLQAEAIRYGVEHLRRHRGRCMGALYWQLNDVWPVASWASVDYYGRYKALQYVAKRFFAPVMISCHETGETTTRPYVVMEQGYYDYATKARLSVANETTSEVTGTVEWELRSANAKVLECGKQTLTVPALSSAWLPEIDFHKTDVENNYLSFRFTVDGEDVSEGAVLFTAPKHFNFVDPHLHCEIKGNEITVFADAYAKYVEIDSPDCDFVLSDNYFDMNAGSKTVKVLRGEARNVRLRSVWDIR